MSSSNATDPLDPVRQQPAAPATTSVALPEMPHAAYSQLQPLLLAHMTMLQAIITRLAGNSASCKTWCAALVTALLSFTAATRLPQLLALTLVPVAVFAFLDAQYLAKERLFRRLFERLAVKVRTDAYRHGDVFDLGASHQPDKCRQLGGALRSWSVWPFYGGLAAFYGLAWCFGWVTLLVQPASP